MSSDSHAERRTDAGRDGEDAGGDGGYGGTDGSHGSGDGGVDSGGDDGDDDNDAATVPEASRDATPTEEDRAALRAFVPSVARNPSALPGVAVAGAALVASGGLLGAAAAAVVAALWAVATPVYAATAAALLFVALETAAPFVATDPIPLDALAAGGVGWLVLAPVLRHGGSAVTVAATIVAAIAFGAVVTAGLQFGALPVAAAVLATAVVLGLYGLHRYSLVRLAYRDLQ